MKTDWERDSNMISRAAAVATAYDASNVTFRVLRAFGWGPLLNLGYYPFGKPLTLLNFLLTPLIFTPFLRLPAAQLKLVRKAVALLDLRGGRRVLDIGYGRGTCAYLMANAFPHAHVTGIDLLPENAAVARTLYANIPNLTYLEGDAMHLDFPDRSFDRVLCLEAAFQFPDRATFLNQLSRLVDTGGRVVIVDFMWKSDAARDICQDVRGRLVRRTWQWENFDSVCQYRENAQASGFQVTACLDWSPHVTAPLGTVFAAVAELARWAWGRAALRWYHPMLRALTDEDWQEFIRSSRAHRYVHRHVQYGALVLSR
jgi:MPBQ/MSBQ methyltransferase